MRASRADRERVVDALKTAFVEERLTRDELDVRAGQAYTSRTYAELAAITADLPAAPRAPAPPAPASARTPAERPPIGRVKKAVLIGTMLTFQPILLVLAILLNNDGAAGVVGISLPVYFIFVTIAGLGLIGSRKERRKRSHRPGASSPAQRPAAGKRPRPRQRPDPVASPPARPENRAHPGNRVRLTGLEHDHGAERHQGSSSTFTAPVRRASFSASTASSQRSSGNRCVMTGVRSKPAETKSK